MAARRRVLIEKGKLEQFGLVKEITGQRRNRAFAYVPYLTVLNQGT